MEITVETEISAIREDVWNAWVKPEHITQWNFALEEWCCPSAKLDLRVGGKFCYRMEAKDGSFGFDFEGEFIKIDPPQSLHFELGDNRLVTVEFIETNHGTKVIETFEVEDENSIEQQKQGWQSMLNHFKKHVEAQRS